MYRMTHDMLDWESARERSECWVRRWSVEWGDGVQRMPAACKDASVWVLVNKKGVARQIGHDAGQVGHDAGQDTRASHLRAILTLVGLVCAQCSLFVCGVLRFGRHEIWPLLLACVCVRAVFVRELQVVRLLGQCPSSSPSPLLTLSLLDSPYFLSPTRLLGVETLVSPVS